MDIMLHVKLITMRAAPNTAPLCLVGPSPPRPSAQHTARPVTLLIYSGFN